MQIVAIHLRQRLAMLDDGQQVGITNLFDCDGDDTDNLDEAVALVAGPTSCGQWLTDSVGCFNEKPVIN